MPFYTDFEIDGMVKTGRKSVVTALEVRFGTVSPQVSDRLKTIEDIDVLENLLRQAITTASVQEFQLILNEIPPSEPTEE